MYQNVPNIPKKLLLLLLLMSLCVIIAFAEWKTGDKHGICKNTKAILFYGTPHRGSYLAALKQTTQMLLWPTIEVQELRDGNRQSVSDSN